MEGPSNEMFPLGGGKDYTDPGSEEYRPADLQRAEADVIEAQAALAEIDAEETNLGSQTWMREHREREQAKLARAQAEITRLTN